MGKLMVKRLDWMDDVARVKQARSLPITDPVREAELLRAMEKRGVASGLPAVAVRPFFAGQMTAARQYQKEWLTQHPGSNLHMKQSPLPDLVKTVRPALDEIGTEMIAALVKARRTDDEAAIISSALTQLTNAGYSATVINPAIQGLKAGLDK